MKKYVVGFAFTEDMDEVVLVTKNRPAWQAGQLNGVGGKVEEGELWSAAMEREFREETGVPEDQQHWALIAMIGDGKYKMAVFAGKGDWALDATTKTDENIARHNVENFIRENVGASSTAIFNIPWLLLMARQMLMGRDKAPYYSIDHSNG